MKDWEKNFDDDKYNFDSHTQLYLSVYRKEHLRNKRIGLMLTPLVILATFVPPLSLLFTIPGLMARAKKSSLGQAIGFSLLAALLPLFSGIMCMGVIGAFKDMHHKIKKTVYKETELEQKTQKLEQIQQEMLAFDPKFNLAKISENLPQKEKVEITYGGNNKGKHKLVAVYMDSAHKAQWAKLFKCGKTLEQYHNNALSEKDTKKQLNHAFQFFQEQHKKSVTLVKKLEEKYTSKQNQL